MDGSQELFLQSSVINKLVVPIKTTKKKKSFGSFLLLDRKPHHHQGNKLDKTYSWVRRLVG